MNNLKLKYLPVETVAILNEVSVNNIKNLLYNTAKGNDIRFKKSKNGKLLVVPDYKRPLHQIVSDVYNNALSFAPNQRGLAFQLSVISGIKRDTIERSLMRFNFVHVDTAITYIVMLNKYISLQKNIEKLYIKAINYCNDIDKLSICLSKRYDISVYKLKQSILNDAHFINLYHLETLLEEFIYAQELISINKNDNKEGKV